MSCVSSKDIRKSIIMASLGFGGGGSGTPTDPNADLQISGGHLYMKDGTRGNKWLSADRLTIFSARNGRARNTYLPYIDGQSSFTTGVRIPRNATILSIVAQTRGAETWNVRVRKNGSATNLASLSLSGVAGGQVTSLNVDVSTGDRIQIYADTSGLLGVRDPNVWIELAWRL